MNDIEILKKLFYDKNNISLSLTNTYKLSKKNNLNLTQQQIKDFYNSQSVNQVYKKQLIKPQYKKIMSPNNDVGNLQADTLFLKKFATKNNGYKYMLNVIDIYSRFAWSFALKNKKPEEVLPHLKIVINDVKEHYPNNKITFTLDSGTEFFGVVKKYLKTENIPIMYANASDNTKQRTMIVERLNKNIWERLSKLLFINGNLRWIDVYEKLINNYNKTRHSSINNKPWNVFFAKSDPIPNIELKVEWEKFNIGDNVRHSIKKNIFDKKSFVENYSIPIYKVKKIEGERYYLENQKGKELQKSYLGRELIKVNDIVNNNDNKFNEENIKNNQLNKFKNKQLKEGLGDVNDNGEIIINKHLVPKNDKRNLKK